MAGKLLAAGIILLITGTIGRLYAANYTYVDADNILRDSAWLPIGSLMMLVGAVLLLVSAVLYGVTYVRGTG